MMLPGSFSLDQDAGHSLRAQVNVAQVRLVQRVPTVLAGVEDP